MQYVSYLLIAGLAVVGNRYGVVSDSFVATIISLVVGHFFGTQVPSPLQAKTIDALTTKNVTQSDGTVTPAPVQQQQQQQPSSLPGKAG